MTKEEIQTWLTYWASSHMVSVDRILAYDQVPIARKYCRVMNVGVFHDVTDGQIWDALREMRKREAKEVEART